MLPAIGSALEDIVDGPSKSMCDALFNDGKGTSFSKHLFRY